jgi:hypothetical protein
VTHQRVVFVLEDVAAGQLWQDSLDGVTDGLPFFLGNGVLFVGNSVPESDGL